MFIDSIHIDYELYIFIDSYIHYLIYIAFFMFWVFGKMKGYSTCMKLRLNYTDIAIKESNINMIFWMILKSSLELRYD